MTSGCLSALARQGLLALACVGAISLGLGSVSVAAREPWLNSRTPSSAAFGTIGFSVSGSQVLFGKVNDALPGGGTQLYVSLAPATPVKPVHFTLSGESTCANDCGGRFTPDGNNIIYTGDFSSRGTIRLYRRQISAAQSEDFSWPSLGNVSTQVRGYEISGDSSSVVFTAEDRVLPAAATTGVSLYSRRLDGVGDTRTLVSNPSPSFRVASFQITPNSAHAVYTGDMVNGFGLPNGGLYSRAIDGTGSALRIGAQASDFVVTPNSSTVVFTQGGALFSVPVAGGTVVSLSNAASGFSVDSFLVSPDGSRVAYRLTGLEAGVSKQYLWSVRVADGGGTVLLTPPSAAGVGGNNASLVSFALGSTRVILRHNKTLASTYKLASASSTGGSAAVDLTSTTGVSVGVAKLSGNGAQIVFSSGAELLSLSVLGGDPVTLSGSPVAGATVSHFVISPDSSRVAFVADRDRIYIVSKGIYQNELYTASIYGGTPTRVSGAIASGTQGADAYFWGIVGRDSTLAFTGDSQAIVFNAEKVTVDNYQIYGTRADGFGKLMDIDGDGNVLATTDLLLILRYKLGLRNAELTNGAKGAPGATRTTDTQLMDQLSYLFTGDVGLILNADGNTSITYHDILLTLRYLLGFRGAPLIADALGPSAVLNTPVSVESFVRRLLESPGL